MPSHKINKPSPVLAALEYRAMSERAQMAAMSGALRRLPAGDGHPVLVLPGFTASDRSTQPLRKLLRDLGYRTYGWGLGTNLGPTRRILDGLVRKLERAHERRGEAVTIIGWSLGGIYARELARSHPELIRQVITLGSPIQMIENDASSASSMFESLSKYHAPGFERHIRDVDREPLLMPSTSIYSRTDGIVSWRSCLIERTDRSENIRVYGSHCGLGFNTAAITAIADRLAQRSDVWSHFRAPWYLRGAYPCAENLDRTRLPASAAA